MQFKTLLAGAVSALLLTGAAQAQDLKVGVGAEPYPPFTSPDASGTWVGWEIDIIGAVCDTAGFDCEVVPTAWDGIIPALLAGRIDVIMNSMSITEDRMQQVNFTDKYYNTPAVIVAPKDVAMELTPEGLEGKILGVQVSTTHQDYAQTHFGDALAEIRTYQTQDEANQDLVAGRIDATQADSIAMQDFVASDAGACCEIKAAVAPDPEILGRGVGRRYTRRIPSFSSS